MKKVAIRDFLILLTLNPGTVTDNTTGLIWLKQTNCLGVLACHKANTAIAGLADGQCRLTDGSVAGDWHLPAARGELATLINKRYTSPMLSDTTDGDWAKRYIFLGVQSGAYLLATSYATYTDGVWLVFLGLCCNTVEYESKIRPHYVWLVRGKQ